MFRYDHRGAITSGQTNTAVSPAPFNRNFFKLGVWDLLDMLKRFPIGTHKVHLDRFCCTLKTLKSLKQTNKSLF